MAVRTRAKESRHDRLGLTLDDVKGMHRKMLECRMIGERMMQLNRMGRAAFHDLPVVFVIENNLYAISTPVSQQMSAAPHERAKGYGIPGLLADGTDVLDVYEKTRQAADRARRGEGPSIVEATCYRYRPHSSDDDDSRYRSKDELQQWLARDPIDISRRYLVDAGVDEKELDAMRAEIGAEIERAID